MEQRAGPGAVSNANLRGRIDDLVKQWEDSENRPDAKTYFLTAMWESLADGYGDLVRRMNDFLSEAVRSVKPQIDIHRVYGRVKTLASIESSIARRSTDVDGRKCDFASPRAIVEAIHDLAALRVVAETREGASRVHLWIPTSERLQEQKTHVSWSLDRGQARPSGSTWWPEHGLYECWNHRVVLVPPPAGDSHPVTTDDMDGFYGVQFELQVTSWADDLYNELAHDLLYKARAGALARQHEVALDLLRGSLKQTRLVLENARLLLRESVHADVFDRIGEEMKRTWRRGLEDAMPDLPPDGYPSDTGRTKESVNSLVVDIKAVVRDAIIEMDASFRRIARDLPIAEGAAFDSPGQLTRSICHSETRVDLLADIETWIAGDSRGIFWLSGLLGTGKSTISRTLATRLQQHSNARVTSFFFRNDAKYESNADRLFTTMAFQLAEVIPELRPHLASVLDRFPILERKHFTFQFDKVLFEPLNLIKQGSEDPVVLIIDALDECGSRADAKTVINLLARLKDLRSTRCKVFLTSRPEQAIYNEFYQLGRRNPNMLRKLDLANDIAEGVLKHDITVFLKSRLEAIRVAYNNSCEEDDEELAEGWPPEESISILVANASGLFIYAATVCLYIEDDRGHPKYQLESVLQGAQFRSLEGMYLKILTDLVSDVDLRGGTEALYREFQATVGPIILLVEPLSARALAALLGAEVARLRQTLKNLRSVIDLPVDAASPVRILHKSFHDFLVDQNKLAEDFYVDRKETHTRLAARCLQLLNSSLKQDICDLGSPGRPKTDIDESKKAQYLPPEVQYACRHWVHHVLQSREAITDGDEVDQFLRHHLLHWLEVMSLLGDLSDCVSLLVQLRERVDGSSVAAKGLLYDAYRFLLYFYKGVEEAPLQLYASGLVFAPENSIVRKVFDGSYSAVGSLVQSRPSVDFDWTSTLMAIDSQPHNESVSLVYSPDGIRVASAGRRGGVKIWESSTGRELHHLPDLEGVVAFPPESSSTIITKRRISPNRVHGACPIIYDCNTGQEVRRLMFPGIEWLETSSIVVCPGQTLAFCECVPIAQGHLRTTVLRWDLSRGDAVRVFETATDCHDMRFSADGRLIAALHIRDFDFGQGEPDSLDDGIELIAWNIDIWSTASADIVHTIEVESNHVPSFASGLKRAFAPDNSQIACSGGIGNRVVTLWKLRERAHTKLWEHDSGSLVISMDFCASGRRIAVGTTRGATLLCAITGDTTHRVENPSLRIFPIAISPSTAAGGISVAYGCLDGALKIWHEVDTPDEAAQVSVTHEGDNHGDGRPNRTKGASLENLRTIWPETTQSPTRSFWAAEMLELQGNADLAEFVEAPTAYSATGLVAAWDGSIHIFDLDGRTMRKGQRPIFEKTKWSYGHHLAFSSDGSRVAFANTLNGELIVQDAHSDDVVFSSINPDGGLVKGRPVTLALSPDGSVLALGTWPTITLWSIDAGGLFLKGRLRCSTIDAVWHTGTVSDLRFQTVVFSPDAMRVAASMFWGFPDTECLICIWDLVNGEECTETLRLRPSTAVRRLEFDDCGSQLSTDSGSYTLGSSPEKEKTAPSEESPETSSTWTQKYGLSADGQWILRDQEAILWLPPDYRPKWQHRACQSQFVGSWVIFRAADRIITLNLV